MRNDPSAPRSGQTPVPSLLTPAKSSPGSLARSLRPTVPLFPHSLLPSCSQSPEPAPDSAKTIETTTTLPTDAAIEITTELVVPTDAAVEDSFTDLLQPDAAVALGLGFSDYLAGGKALLDPGSFEWPPAFDLGAYWRGAGFAYPDPGVFLNLV